MNDVKMPEPAGHIWIGENGDFLDIGSDQDECELLAMPAGKHLLITTDQAQAYADARVREAQQWQPIETAPKDGTNIMLTNGSDVAEGHWYYEQGGIREHRDLDGRWIGQDESEGYDGWLDWDGGMVPEPTHWMPLPAPPK